MKLDVIASHAAGKLKMILLNFAVVYPTLTVSQKTLVPLLSFLSPEWRQVVMVMAMCVVLTFVLPWAQRRLAGVVVT